MKSQYTSLVLIMWMCAACCDASCDTVEVSGVEVLFLLHPRSSKQPPPLPREASFEDNHDGTITVFETAADGQSRFTSFVTKKCPQGFRYDPKQNRCRDPIYNADDPSLGGSYLRYCGPGTTACDQPGFKPGFPEADYSCQMDRTAGLDWRSMWLFEVATLTTHRHFHLWFPDLHDRWIWAPFQTMGANETVLRASARPGLSPGYTRSRSKTERAYVMCIAGARGGVSYEE